MSQFQFGDLIKVDGITGDCVYVRPHSDQACRKDYAWVCIHNIADTTCVNTSRIHHINQLATTCAPATPTTPAPSDEIDTKIIAIINQLRQSMRHWIGAMLDISVPQHGLSETNRIYHTANELEQRLVDYRDLLSANIASRQEGAACGS